MMMLRSSCLLCRCFRAQQRNLALSVQIQKELKSPKVSNVYVNRNPRNLEMMGIARKPSGLSCTYPNKNYYHCLEISTIKNQLELKVVHNSGFEVTTVSTESEHIKKYIYAPFSLNTYKILGGILGRRLVNFGITSLTIQTFSESEKKRPKMEVLMEALTNEGVELSEIKPIDTEKWPVPLNKKKLSFTPQPNSMYDMLGSKDEDPYFKRQMMRKAIEQRNELYFNEQDEDYEEN